DARTFYFGAVGGGVWKTENAGRTWKPIFDSTHVASVGALAVAPSDSNVIYVGTGEADMRSDITYGKGMFKSTDAGKTWTHIGLEDSRQIGKVLVDPRDSKIVWVAALGHAYASNPERGVFKSIDGGQTWKNVLYKNPSTGAIDLAMDPHNDQIVYASMWQTRRPPWNVYPPSNGPNTGLYRTADGGATWEQVNGHGLPSALNRIGIAISPADSNRIYLAVNAKSGGGIYRSNDAGASWKLMDTDERLWKRGWYFGGVTADPKNPDRLYVLNTSMYRTEDGAKTFKAIKGAPGGDDNHTLWIDPSDAQRMIMGGDQGTVISLDDAKTWSSWYNQPTGQFYHAIADNRFPYWIYGAQQDSGAAMILSHSGQTYIYNRDWQPIDVGGESGYIAPDPLRPGIIYGTTVTRENVIDGQEQDVDPTLAYPGVYRSTWTLPVVFSAADPHVLYFSHQYLFRTSNGGKTWSKISPDLSRVNAGVPPNLDATTAADNLGNQRRGVIYAIAPSPLKLGVIWTGTDDGLIWRTADEGHHWSNVTPKALTPWSKVGIIDASHFDTRSAYAAVDRHRLDDLRPYIYRTHDNGKTWTAITDGIPVGSYVNVVREDPMRKGLLYAGTETGVFVSFDDGDHWQSLQLNLPTASVRDIDLHDGDIIIATHGRAFWVLTDASPLRQLSAQIAASKAWLYKPALALRIRPGTDQGTPLPPEEPRGENPPIGALIDYYLQSTPTAPVVFDIYSDSGKLVRSFSSADKPHATNPKSVDFPAYWLDQPEPLAIQPGMHRLVWDLHDGKNGPWVTPGTYTVKMHAAGKTYSQALRVGIDQRISAGSAELRKQYDLAMAILATRAQVQSLQDQSAARLKVASKEQQTPARTAYLKSLNHLIGVAPPTDPNNSVGPLDTDISSLRYLGNALDGLEQTVESADAAPTPDTLAAYTRLRALYAKNKAAWEGFKTKG
ncbi:MAG: hypothetical protein ABI182_05860, partial [Candidatus Baltobacteraceae bacterium]